MAKGATRMRVLAVTAALCAILAIGCVIGPRIAMPRPVVLASDAYIWQRSWSGRVVQAARAAHHDISAWHILAAECDQTGSWHDAHLDNVAGRAVPDVLASHPIIAVFRLSGRRLAVDPAGTAAHIRDVLALWKTAGITVSGIELDHDCPTAELQAYASFLVDLRRYLAPATAVIITALPTWLGSPALPSLLARADRAVLQLHAVRNPVEGLFSPASAQRAAEQFGPVAAHNLRSGHWLIALPSYGSRVVWDQEKRVALIESEISQGMASVAGQELVADPRRVAAFMRGIEAHRPKGLEGWVWFRLPVAGDRRAWSMESWLTVLRHAPVIDTVSVTVHSAGHDFYQVILSNTGTVDATLPRIIYGDNECVGMGAQSPYHLEYEPEGAALVTTAKTLLPVGRTMVGGWLTCANKKEAIHVTQATVRD